MGLIANMSALYRVMALRFSGNGHYLIQCWPRSVMPYGIIRTQKVKSGFNLLIPGRLEWKLIQAIFNLTLVNGGRGIKRETAFRSMSLDITKDKSTLVLVMAWCHQATSHYLSEQCWPRPLPPYGVTRSQGLALILNVVIFKHISMILS